MAFLPFGKLQEEKRASTLQLEGDTAIFPHRLKKTPTHPRILQKNRIFPKRVAANALHRTIVVNPNNRQLMTNERSRLKQFFHAGFVPHGDRNPGSTTQ